MEVATTTTEVALSAIHESLAKLTVTLHRIAARQESMLVGLKKTTAALTPTATTMSLAMLDQASTRLETKPSSHKVSRDGRDAAATVSRVSHALSAVAPTWCSTLGVDINGGRNHAALTSLSWGNTEAALLPPLEPSLDKPLQSYVDLEFNMRTPTTCSVQCCHDGNGMQKLASLPASISGSSPTSFLLDGPEFSATPSVTGVTVGVKINSVVTPLMIDRMADDVFTDVGGVSLFLKHFVQPAEMVFSELHSMELEGEVFYTVEGLSLFPKDGLGSTNEVCDAVLLEDMSRSDEVLTHVGGLSLFLEFYLDPNTEFGVLTCVGDCFIFLEPSMCGPTEVFDAPPKVDMDKVLNHGVGVPSKGCKLQQLLSQEMQQHGTNCDTHVPWDPGQQKAGINSLFSWRRHADKCVIQCSLCVDSRTVTDIHALQSVNHHDKMPPWVRGGFSPGDCATEDDHFEFIKLLVWTRSNFCPGKYGMRSKVCTFKEVPPWRRNAFSPGHSVIQGNHLLLESIQPWRQDVFSSRKSTLMKPNEQKWARGDLQVEKMQIAVILPWFCFVTQTDVQKFSHELITCSQRPPMLATPIQAMEISDKYYRQVQSDDTAQPKCCMLHKIRELNISTITGFPWAPQSGTIARNLWYMLALIGNIYVVLDCINLWPTETKMALYRIEADNLAGHTYVLEDPLETLVITLPHTYGSLAEFPVMVNSAQYFCNFRTGDLDRELQYSPCNLDVQNQMIRQVQQELWKCYYFCFLILLANHLQYKQWDPGVMCNLSADGIHIFSARPRRIADQISWLRRRFLYRSWSCSLLQHEQAIAWGQAMFFGGGIVMSSALGDVGLGLMGW